MSLCKLVQHWNGNVILMAFSSLVALKVVTLTTFSATSDENFIKMMTFLFQWKAISKQHCYGIQKQHWPSTEAILTQHKAILTQYKSNTDAVQKRYRLIPFLVPLHNVSVPAVPEPVTSPVLVYGTGTCTGTVCKTCIERYRFGTLYRIQRYRTGTTYHRWTVPERVPIDTGMFTGRVVFIIWTDNVNAICATIISSNLQLWYCIVVFPRLYPPNTYLPNTDYTGYRVVYVIS